MREEIKSIVVTTADVKPEPPKPGRHYVLNADCGHFDITMAELIAGRETGKTGE